MSKQIRNFLNIAKGKYSGVSNPEFEIRKPTDFLGFLQFLVQSNQARSPVITSFIRSASSLRQESIYINGDKKSEIRHVKTELHAAKIDGGIKLSLANEKPETNPKAVVSMPDYAALKFRVTWQHGDWSMEPTMILPLPSTDVSRMSKAIKQYFAPGAKTIQEYYNRISSSGDGLLSSLLFNIEIEWQGDGLPDETDIADVLGMLSDNQQETGIFARIAGLIGARTRNAPTLKRLLVNPITLTKLRLVTELQHTLTTDYMVAAKTDGVTALILTFTEQNMPPVVLTDAQTKSDTDIPEDILVGKITPGGVIVAEKIADKLIAFDMLYDKASIAHKSYSDRIKHMQDAVAELGAGDWGDASANAVAKNITTKNIRHMGDTPPEDLQKMITETHSDGLILTEDAPYHSAKIWKFKDIAHNTIDFLMVHADKKNIKLYDAANNAAARAGVTPYVLCSGISDMDYRLLSLDRLALAGWDEHLRETMGADYLAVGTIKPIPFRPALNTEAYLYWPTDAAEKLLSKSAQNHQATGAGANAGSHTSPAGACRVGEFSYNMQTNTWTLIGLRDDRAEEVRLGTGYGNYYGVAEEIFMNYYTPITLENLLSPPDQGYFQTVKDPKFQNMIAYNNFVKFQVLQQYRNTETIIDLSSGKGQDLVLYNGLGITRGKFIDIDGIAIAELLRRRANLSDRKWYKYTVPPTRNMLVQVNILDLNTDADGVLSHIRGTGMPPNVGAVICNLALHYLVPEGFANIYNIVDGLLPVGGKFTFSTFCAERIRQEFMKADEITFNTDHFSIKYNGDLAALRKEMPEHGTISVKLPFSKDEYYTENLVNISKLVQYFTGRRYKLLQQQYFDAYEKKYKGQISGAEIAFSSLYCYVTLIKG